MSLVDYGRRHKRPDRRKRNDCARHNQGYEGVTMSKIVLLDADGMTQHAQGYLKITLETFTYIVKRNERFYVFDDMKVEQGKVVFFYKECEQPMIITEF